MLNPSLSNESKMTFTLYHNETSKVLPKGSSIQLCHQGQYLVGKISFQLSFSKQLKYHETGQSLTRFILLINEIFGDLLEGILRVFIDRFLALLKPII